VAVKIRLKRMGKIRTPFYRVVVADSRKKRDGKVIEEIGTYNPKTEPSLIHIESERAQYWLGVGAQPSEAVQALLKITGDWETFTGEKQTRTLEVAEPKRDKSEIFNEALKEIHGEGGKSASATTKKAAKKSAAKDEAGDDEAKAEPADAITPKKKAESKPEADVPAADEAKADEAPDAEQAETAPSSEA